MEKRTNKKIEADVQAIKEAAKTATSLKEVSDILGLSYQKICTSLSRHPIIRKRVVATLEANNASKTNALQESISSVEETTTSCPPEVDKYVVICDCPALLYGLRSCSGTPIVIPQFVEDSITGISFSNSTEGQKANTLLTLMSALYDWCTVIPRLSNESLIVEPTTEFSWRAKALVALACKYWRDGYIVTVKTRTGEVYNLARIQKCLTVDFVPADDEINLKTVS